MRLRVGAAQLNPVVGDLDANATAIIDAARRARDAGCDLVAFGELAVCGYPPEDLLLRPGFIAECDAALDAIVAAVPDIVMVVGSVHHDNDLHNAAAICWGGQIVGWYHKRHLPNYGVFDEQRYFRAGADNGPLFRRHGVTFGVTICEDVWMPDGPLLDQARAGAELAININGSPFHRGKMAWRRRMLATRASDAAMPLVFVNMVGGQDELVFDGGSMRFDAEGTLVATAPQFEQTLAIWDIDCTDAFRRRLRDTRPRSWPAVDLAVVDIDALAGPGVHVAPPPLPAEHQTVDAELDDVGEVYAALRVGVRDYLVKNGFRSAVLGLSGGIDSSLVAAVAVDALGPDAVVGIAMPSPYSSEHSISDAYALAANLGIRCETAPISPAFATMLDTVDSLFTGREPDVTEENIQARLRGIILMAYSNKFGSLLLTTGNKSEMATGYCTLYGDMAGGYAVIKDVPKTLVYELCRWRNAAAGRELVPETVLTKPPSAELRPNQFDQDSLPPYDILDAVIEAYVERDMIGSEIVAAGIAPADIVARVVRLIDGSEYKRRQAPPGVRITPKAFGRDRRLPLTNRFRPTIDPGV